MASMSLVRVLCMLHEQAESEEVAMWLLGRQERAVYGKMMLDLLGKRDEEAQIGAGCFLIVAAWVRRLDAFPISDLLLLQILDAEKVFNLQPLIPELVAALASLVSAKGDQLTCEWLYLLSILTYVHTSRPDDANISCQVAAILEDVLRLRTEERYKGDAEALVRTAGVVGTVNR